MTSSEIVLACILAALPYLFYQFQIGRRKQTMLRFKIRRVGVTMIAYVAGIIVASRTGYTVLESVIFGFLLGVAAGFILVRYPDRPRRIPKHVRRAVIERDLKGEPFDPTRHHLDHIIPFSKGGDHSVANLRVLDKTENMRRGSRMPHWKELL